MPTLKQALSPLLCCLGVRTADENQTTSELRTPHSALSIPLPSSTIPHALGRSESFAADADALRQIFRSNSSVRGYQTAALQPTPSHRERRASLDTDFQLGSNRTERKLPNRLEQLGTHIKQKLSETRLSKSSSRPHIESEDGPLPTPIRKAASVPGPGDLEMTLSQRSTGLLDLLMSRTGSEGGYDSDARSIQTTALKGSDGTMRLSPRAAQTIARSSTKQYPVETDGAPPSPPQSSHGTAKVADSPSPHAARLSPSLSQTSFARAELAGKDGFPTNGLKRLSIGIANGSIHLPDILDPGFVMEPLDLQVSEREVVAALPQTGPPAQLDVGFMGAMKRLSDTVAAAKRASIISEGDDPRSSLVSNLDPTLIDFISKFGEPDSTDSLRRPGAPSGALGSNPVPLERLSSQMSTSRGRDVSKRDLTSLAESDRSSIHLYNMRISQRLASPSFVATSSRPNTSHSSIQQRTTKALDGSTVSRRASEAGRFPSFVGVEHNRRPSDPQTRRLFEDDTASDKGREWHIPVVPSDSAWNSDHTSSMLPRDDASSFYWSNGEVDDVGGGRPRASRRNLNSLAVGGRSESISLPIACSYASMSHLSVAEEGAWFSRKSSQQRREPGGDRHLPDIAQRARSLSMPDRNNINLPQSAALHGMRPGCSTEANEAMSDISLGPLQDARGERLTEISAQAVRDAQNERMSEAEPPHWSSDNGGRREDSSLNRLPTREDETPRPLQETTTDLWQRSFQRVIQESEERSLGGFLASPKFDRHGRRRSTRSSVSAVHSEGTERMPDSEQQWKRKSQSQRESSEPVEMPHVRVCMKKPEPLPVVNPRRSSATLDGRKQAQKTLAGRKPSRKESLLELGRRFTVIGASVDEERSSGASTPLRDILGLWGRFPSHTRAERAGPAGAKDGVVVQDFAADEQDENSPSKLTQLPGVPAVTPSLHVPGSWGRLPFGMKSRIEKSKSKSMSLPRNGGMKHSTTVRARKSLKGLTGRWKKLYRSSSSDLRAYTHTYGHRSSISMRASVEYPELEVVPGVDGLPGKFNRPHGWGSWTGDGAADTTIRRHQREAAGQSLVRPPHGEQLPWARRYESCVGSLSALKSENELEQPNLDERPGREHDQSASGFSSKSAELRDSTVDFETQLGKEHEAVRERLIRKIENIESGERGDVMRAEGAVEQG